jgi:pimeloyl-ACP methyl ester carboxylesterase
MADIAQACWEAVDAASMNEPAILVGLSVGGHLVRQMYHLRPDQTAALIIAGHGYRPEKPNMLRRAEQYETRGVEFRREHALEDFSVGFRQTPLAQYFADMFQERNAWADAKSIATVFRAYAPPDPEWLTAGIQVPTLIITGSEDNAHQASFELQRRIRGCELVTIEGAGHACNIEQPWVFDRVLLEFLHKHGWG